MCVCVCAFSLIMRAACVRVLYCTQPSTPYAHTFRNKYDGINVLFTSTCRLLQIVWSWEEEKKSCSWSSKTLRRKPLEGREEKRKKRQKFTVFISTRSVSHLSVWFTDRVIHRLRLGLRRNNAFPRNKARSLSTSMNRVWVSACLPLPAFCCSEALSPVKVGSSSCSCVL